MATLTAQQVDEDGLNATYSAADGAGDEFVNPVGGTRLLHVKNDGGGSITVTITAQKTSLTLADYGLVTKANGGGSVPNGEERFVGPFPPEAFNDSAGKVQVTYSGVTSVTVAVLAV